MTLARDLEFRRAEVRVEPSALTATVYVEERIIEGTTVVMQRDHVLPVNDLADVLEHSAFIKALAAKAKKVLAQRDTALADLPIHLPGSAVTKTVTEVKDRQVLA
jgi:hypothetical protein